MVRKGFVRIGLAILLLTAGCVRNEPGSGGEVGFYGTMNVSDSRFVMAGQITLGGGTTNQDEFDNVTVYLFTKNGTLLRTHPAGTLTGLLNVSIASDRVPHYVIIDSPDFWRENRITVRYYYRLGPNRDRDYGVRDARSVADYPVPTSSIRNRSAGSS